MQKVRIQAQEYMSARSLAEAGIIQKKNGVRYSDLLRLYLKDLFQPKKYNGSTCIIYVSASYTLGQKRARANVVINFIHTL